MLLPPTTGLVRACAVLVWRWPVMTWLPFVTCGQETERFTEPLASANSNSYFCLVSGLAYLSGRALLSLGLINESFVSWFGCVVFKAGLR